jgi:GMP synthase (glutamine-hydrolysing)
MSPENPVHSPALDQPEVLVIEHEPDCPPAVLADVLCAEGVTVHLVRAHLGEQVPDDLRGVEGLVVLGGGMDADDDAAHPWFPAVRALVRTARDRRVPTLGICLGAQQLALALEGAMGRRAVAEVGILPVVPSADGREDPLIAALGDDPQVLQWHQDQVTSLPPASRLLATGTDGAVQAFVTEDLAWGVQFHPEVTPEVVARWAETSDLLPEGATPETAAAAVEEAEGPRASWRALLAAFARVVHGD